MTTTQTTLDRDITTTEPGFAWTQERAEKAAREGKYISVGGSNLTYRVITGAPKYWNSENEEEKNTVYLPGVRLTGTKENVEKALQLAGFGQEQIDSSFENALTKENSLQDGELTEKYLEEVKNMKSARAKGTKKKGRYTQLDQLLALVPLAGEYKLTNKPGKTGTAAQPRGGQRLSLGEKYQKVEAEGKILDVSNMDETGKGARITATPSKETSQRTGKYIVDGINIMSNNAANYERALRLIWKESVDTEDALQDALNMMSELLAEHAQKIRQAGVSAKEQPSPPKQKKSPKAKKTTKEETTKRDTKAATTAKAQRKVVEKEQPKVNAGKAKGTQAAHSPPLRPKPVPTVKTPTKASNKPAAAASVKTVGGSNLPAIPPLKR
jgi:hypothetical protein